MSVARRGRPRARDDGGSGGVLAVAIVAVTLIVATTALLLATVLVARQRAAGAADAAALAAADVLLGVVPGDPCRLASAVATANGARLIRCDLVGAEAHVTVSVAVATGAVRASARAGPPP